MANELDNILEGGQWRLPLYHSRLKNLNIRNKIIEGSNDAMTWLAEPASRHREKCSNIDSYDRLINPMRR